MEIVQNLLLKNLIQLNEFKALQKSLPMVSNSLRSYLIISKSLQIAPNCPPILIIVKNIIPIDDKSFLIRTKIVANRLSVYRFL